MRSLILVTSLLLALLMCSCQSLFGKYEVTCKAWGSCSDVKIRYYEKGKGTETTLEDLALPWVYSYRTSDGDQYISVSVSRENVVYGSELYAEIWVNDVLLASDDARCSEPEGKSFMCVLTGIVFPSQAGK